MPLGDIPVFGSVTVDPSWRIAVIRSVWHPECTGPMQENAVEALRKAGIPVKNIVSIDAPGSFELPVLAKHAIESLKVDGVIVFGVVVQGATHHARLVAEQAAAGCMQLQMRTGVPVTFEVLFVDDIKDAVTRSVGKDGKGPLAAATLLSCLAKVREMRS